MPPAPVMTTLRTSGLRSATLSASMHAAPMEGSIALCRPGVAQGQYQRLTFTGAQQLGGHGLAFFDVGQAQADGARRRSQGLGR